MSAPRAQKTLRRSQMRLSEDEIVKVATNKIRPSGDSTVCTMPPVALTMTGIQVGDGADIYVDTDSETIMIKKQEGDE